MLRDKVEIPALLYNILGHEAVQAYDPVFTIISGKAKVLMAAQTSVAFSMTAWKANSTGNEIADV